MRFFRASVIGLAAFCMLAPAARAQDVADAPPPPELAFVDGSATLDREDASEPAAPGTPLVPGDRVRTARGRVEVLFPDGSALDIDEYSAFELQAPTLIRVTSGRVLMIVAGAGNPAAAARFQIDTPIASAQTDGPGEYRVAIISSPSGIETEMAVVRGTGALVTERGSMPLRAGERSVARDDAQPSAPQYFNSARFDAFDRWASARRDERVGSRSAQYLPSDLRMYGGTLDRSGAWEYEAPYGYVWYPTVAPDWRPYYDGYWSAVPTYGWTWIGVELWSWPTHHYGRWGYGDSRWFWIPERRWAPAWVSWGGAPGYVSWCPLGFNNRAVFALSVSSRNWSAGWTVLPREHFGGRGRNVHQFAVSPRSLPANTAFVTQTAAPVAPPHAVARRSVGGMARPASVDRQQPSFGGHQTPVDGRQSGSDGRQSASGGRQSAGVSRQPGGAGRQVPGAEQPASASRSPQAVSRQPQAQAPQAAQPAGRPPYDGGDRGAFRSPLPDTVRGRTPSTPSTSDGVIYTNRARMSRPSASAPTAPPQAASPSAPASPERQRYGTAVRRPDSVVPPAAASAAPESQPTPMPRRGPPASQRYERPPSAAPAAAPPPPPPQQRDERPSAPPRERRSQQQARPRGHEAQQSGSTASKSGSSSSSSSPPAEHQQNQGGGNGHGSRRPR